MNPRGYHRLLLNGRPGNVSYACKKFIVRAHKAGLYVTSTTGGKHATGSYHYPRTRFGKGRAVDVAGPYALMIRFQRAEHRRGRRYLELFGPDNRANRKYGGPFRLVEGSALENLHDTHVHGAPRW